MHHSDFYPIQSLCVLRYKLLIWDVLMLLEPQILRDLCLV